MNDLALLARGATAIREVIAGRLEPHDALALTVWPSARIIEAEGELPDIILQRRVTAMRIDFTRPGRRPAEHRRCGGCGIQADDRTAGCSACNDRHRSRVRQAAE